MLDGENKSKPNGGINLTTAAQLVAAYVSNNSIRTSDLTALIETIYGTLDRLSNGVSAPIEDKQLVPAVPVKKSVTPDFLICLEDGKKFRSLKRHLGTVYNLNPDQYRAKWGLPRDYPMVAPAYSAVRSRLAKSIGLGRPALPAAANTAPKTAAVAARKRSARTKRTP